MNRWATAPWASQQRGPVPQDPTVDLWRACMMSIFLLSSLAHANSVRPISAQPSKAVPGMVSKASGRTPSLTNMGSATRFPLVPAGSAAVAPKASVQKPSERMLSPNNKASAAVQSAAQVGLQD